jgi:hypothetical protein
MNYSCPNCGSDQTQKITAIVAAGTSHAHGAVSTTSLLSAQGGFGSAYSEGSAHSTHSTELATKLAKPVPQPIRILGPLLGWFILAVLGTVIFIVIFAGILGLLGPFGQRVGAIIHIPIFGFPFYGLVLTALFFISTRSVFRSAGRAREYNRDIYPVELERWQNEFYCHRCDQIFTPAA